MTAVSLRFARSARALGAAARLAGIDAPTFRSPPARTDAMRTMKRRGEGVVVSVAINNRPWNAVLADMIDGVVVANGLEGYRADLVRTELWRAMEEIAVEQAA